MPSLRDLLPLVTPLLPGCSDIQALQALRLSAIDWCERTRCWRFAVEPGVATYIITPETLIDSGQTISIEANYIAAPAYGVVHEIEHVHVDGEPVSPVVYTDVVPLGIDAGSSARYMTQIRPGTLLLYPALDGEITLSLYLKPRPPHEHAYTVAAGLVLDAYDELPAEVVGHHSEPIAWGALSRLYLQAAEPWADAALAALYEGKVTDRADTQAVKAIRGQQRAPLRARVQWV